MTQQRREPEKKTTIIECILTSNYEGVRNAIRENPNSVNSIHEDSGMSAPMLALYGRLQAYFELMLEEAGNQIDFAYTDQDGDDILSVAIGTANVNIIQCAEGAYSRFAPQLVNNWPEP